MRFGLLDRLWSLTLDDLLHDDQFLFPDQEVEEQLHVFVVLDGLLVLLQGEQEVEVDVSRRKLVLKIELF